MAVDTTANLLVRANAIRTETAGAANSASRVGGLIRDIIDSRSGDDVYDITGSAFGAATSQTPSYNLGAINDAIDAAGTAGGGVILVPGDRSTQYGINGQVLVEHSNITILAPGGAGFLLSSAIPVPIAVGDIDTGIDLTQANTLASNALAGSMSVTLAAGKGANITAGSYIVIRSSAVVPGHVGVVNKRAEIVNVFSVSTDTLSLSAPLRYDYLTADAAEVNNVDWIENFSLNGLQLFGNNQINCTIGVQMNWCLKPTLLDPRAIDLQQRFLRFQGCLDALVVGMRQQNGLSNGFQGDVGHNAYAIIESGLNKGLVSVGAHIDRCRHGYTTGAGWTNNSGTTSVVITGIGVPQNSRLVDSIHTNARGTGWDTHEVGEDIEFHNCQTLGGLFHGFVSRSVRTKFVNCHARGTIGAAMQLGSDAVDTTVRGFTWENTNLGTDDSTSTDWTVRSPIIDNSATPTYLDQPAPNALDNGSFDIWDRGTSFTATGGTANRWKLTLGTGAAVTVSRQTHPVPATMGNVGRYFLRFDRGTAGSDSSYLAQYIDDVRTLAGQRVVLSYDARTDTDGTELRVLVRQHFGTGGSPSANVDTTAVVRSLGTSWGREVAVIDVPSISGKTIGSNEDSALLVMFELDDAEGTPFVDLDRVKLEVGRSPTTFVAESLATTRERCQAWFEKSYLDGQNPGSASASGNVQIADSVASANYYRTTVFFATRKGRAPTITYYASGTGTVAKVRNVTAGTDIDPNTVNTGQSSFVGGINSGADVTGGDIVRFSWTAAVADFE